MFLYSVLSSKWILFIIIISETKQLQPASLVLLAASKELLNVLNIIHGKLMSQRFLITLLDANICLQCIDEGKYIYWDINVGIFSSTVDELIKAKKSLLNICSMERTFRKQHNLYNTKLKYLHYWQELRSLNVYFAFYCCSLFSKAAMNCNVLTVDCGPLLFQD